MASEQFKPTHGMIAEAKQGLAWRKKYDRGGTLVGVARANDIISGKPLTAEIVVRMASFFARAGGTVAGPKGKQPPSRDRIAWALCGGDEGYAWSKKIAERLVKRGNVATMLEMRYRGYSIERALLESRNCGTGSGGFQPGNDCARGTGGGRYDHSPGEPRMVAYKSKEGSDARDAQGREYPPTVTSLADRQSWDDDIQAAELDPGYEPQDVVDDIIVEKFGDVDIEAGFSGTKFISQGANPALQEWMDKQGFKGPPAKAMEQIVRMAEAEAWERIKRDARDLAAKKLRARTSTTYPPGKGPIRRWLLDLQKHLLEMRADCGTGAGGFKPGNDCAKNKAGKDGDGDGEFERGRKESGASEPKASKPKTLFGDQVPEQLQLEGIYRVDELETDDGRVVEQQITSDGFKKRIDRISEEAERDGVATEWGEVLDMQPDLSRTSGVDFYEAKGFLLLTDQEMTDRQREGAMRQLDLLGADFGTITQEEIDRRVEEFSTQLEKDDPDRDGKLNKFQAKLKDQQAEARKFALSQMRRDLESSAAKAKIDGKTLLFRGLSLPKDVLGRMIESGSVNHTGVNSWTTNADMAGRFKGGFGEQVVLVTTRARVGIVNKNPGQAGQENEVIRPPSSMKIQKVVRTQDTTFIYVDEDELYKD